MVGARETGNETYTVSLLRGLAELADENRYEVLTPSPERLRASVTLPPRFEVIRVWPGTSALRIPVAIPIASWRAASRVLHMTTYITPLKAPCPMVVTIHDLSFLEYPRAFSLRVRTILRTLVPGSIARAARVIAVSEFTKQDVIRRYGVAPEKITVTPLAPAPGFSRMANPAQASLPAGVTEPYVLSVGNLEPRKNLDRLLEAFAVLVGERRFTGSLVLVGKDALRSDSLRRITRERGIESRVIFTGFVTQPELNALYNRAALFVYPSLYEGYGLPPIEAMACGCPVVASNVSVLPETTGGVAVLVDPRSTTEIANAMSAILHQPELARQLRERGLRHASSFSWTTTAARTLEVYAAAAAQPRIVATR